MRITLPTFSLSLACLPILNIREYEIKIPSIGLPFPDLLRAPYALYERVTNHWREDVLKTGAATSVALAAHGVFSGSKYWVAFTTLSGICLVGVHSLQQYAALQKLEASVAVLEKENKELQEIKLHMERLSASLHQENSSLKESNEALKERASDFRQECELLTRTNIHLTENNSRLTLQLSHLHGMSERINGLLAELGKTNESFSLQVDLQGKDQEALSKLVQEFDENIKRHLEQLGQEILRSQACHEEVFTYLDKHNASLHAELQELSTMMQDLKATESTLSKIKEWTHLKEELLATSSELIHVQAELQSAQKVFQEESGKLAQVRQELREETHKLSAIREQFETLANTAQEKTSALVADLLTVKEHLSPKREPLASSARQESHFSSKGKTPVHNRENEVPA